MILMLTVDENPISVVGSSCTLLTGFAFCIQENFGVSTTSTTLSTVTTLTSLSLSITSASPTSTSSGNGIATPTPFQAGMATNCNAFHLVVSGDECDVVAASAGVSLADFLLWNPAVGSACQFLGLGDFVCIDVIGVTPTTSVKPTTTSAGNGITTPNPFQAGMATNCNAFHLVVSGDECAVVAANAGISITNFISWNPAVGPSCSFLDLGDFVCIDIIGVTPTTSVKPTSISAGNGVATPTPIQPGMVTNCNKFHLVVSGDQCGLIATAAGITLANFFLWNPSVGNPSCGSLFLGDFVCIDIL